MSCRNRCYEVFDEAPAGCRCDHNCEATNSCCYDFYDLCKAPSEWLRCLNISTSSCCGLSVLEQRSCGSAPGCDVESRGSQPADVGAPTTVCLRVTAAPTTGASATVRAPTAEHAGTGSADRHSFMLFLLLQTSLRGWRTSVRSWRRRRVQQGTV